MEGTNNQLEIIKMIKERIAKCGTNLYPEICALRHTKNGEDMVVRGVLDIISKTAMTVDSAIAQYESSMN